MLGERRRIVRNKKWNLFPFWDKKRLEPLKKAHWAILSLSRISGLVPVQEWLGSSAHRLRAEPMATLNKWCKVQLAYIPDIGLLIANTTLKLLSATQSFEAEDIPLFLPLSLSSNLQSTLGFMKPLADHAYPSMHQLPSLGYNLGCFNFQSFLSIWRPVLKRSRWIKDSVGFMNFLHCLRPGSSHILQNEVGIEGLGRVLRDRSDSGD